MSSLGSPITAIVCPNGADCPSLIRILRRTPFARACISIVALSVSISASGSPMETLSPSFFNQREICPSSIVGESFGMITFVAIRRSLRVRNKNSSLCNLCVLCVSVVIVLRKEPQRHRGHRDCTEINPNKRLRVQQRRSYPRPAPRDPRDSWRTASAHPLLKLVSQAHRD